MLRKTWRRAYRMRISPLVCCLCCLVVFSGCSLTLKSSPLATSPTPTPDTSARLPAPPSQDPQRLSQAEQLLLMTPHPLSDLQAIAKRLKHISPRPIANLLLGVPLAHAAPGRTDSFWINDHDSGRYRRISARLVVITAHTYVYVEDGQAVNLNALQAAAATFESSIYPRESATFGAVRLAGAQAALHLTILNAAGLGSTVSGYFASEDAYSTGIDRYSNQRAMIYVNLDGPIPASADYDSTLANEFQQMLHWYRHPQDPPWLNEGMSILARQLNGFSSGGVAESFLQSPDTQLNDWSDDPQLNAAHDGASYLFMDYFATHYGGYAILRELLQDPASPPDNFNHVLAAHGYRDTFFDVLQKWYVANYVQDSSVEQGAYGYPDTSLAPLAPQHTGGLPLSAIGSLHQYAAEYYVLSTSARRGTLTVDFNGAPRVRLLPNDPFGGAAAEWWSNRSNDMDSTLTRSFDLSHIRGRRATLQFAAWFDLARNVDYAYVEVSTGDDRWTTLQGRHTTASNPNGVNWGNGYTGVSGGSDQPAWVQEEVNLSPYVGKHIAIRFEVITASTANSQGLALDALRIPELRFQDSVSGAHGWVSNGFVRTQNALPQHFALQVLLFHATQFSVSEVAVDEASGEATLKIAGYGRSVTRIVLIVSAYAVETTQPAQYQLDMRVR